MGKESILVLTNSQDGRHSEAVIEKLEKKGETVFRLDVDKIFNGDTIVEFFADEKSCNFLAKSKGKVITSEGIKSAWYRRPNHFDMEIANGVQKTFAENELKGFLEGLYLCLPDIFWLNNPRSLETARRKVFQLQLARELGFVIPRTIVSNNAESIKDFYISCGRRIIYKTIKSSFLNFGERAFNIPTTLMTDALVEKFSRMKNVPSLFQECVEKKYEIRVTVVGKEIFPVKINSQENVLTEIDWRHPDLIDKIGYEKTKLPQEVEKRVILLMDRLKLDYGAIDLIFSTKGDYVFLEINPNGQWYWLEELAGIKVSDAIAKILKKGGASHENRDIRNGMCS